jgi:hypothetical protein
MELKGSLPRSQDLAIGPILSQLNSVHTFTPDYFKIHVYIILQSIYTQTNKTFWER